ncbi:hypothetical protein DK847_13155 [Aestuariivirga litoralis]|uniref:PilZ domain-containing protein n=2 Tax=Aestuariivirga litoralis TaxID=2650924 RepID=A0A2W2C7I6_9HYPH|nr:hypothetical protein DK847_13155 [Aestuariivirga litoralis]
MVRNLAMRFAEIVHKVGRRIHIGCIMAAGQDWVEVSLPKATSVESGARVRFMPADAYHEVAVSWRTDDRVGFTYVEGGPPEEQFAGFAGLTDPRPAFLKMPRS